MFHRPQTWCWRSTLRSLVQTSRTWCQSRPRVRSLCRSAVLERLVPATRHAPSTGLPRPPHFTFGRSGGGGGNRGGRRGRRGRRGRAGRVELEQPNQSVGARTGGVELVRTERTVQKSDWADCRGAWERAVQKSVECIASEQRAVRDKIQLLLQVVGRQGWGLSASRHLCLS